MRVTLTDEQLAIVTDLVDERIKTIHPEIRRSRVYTVRDDLKHDLEVLQKLHEELLEAQQGEPVMQAWEGYAESRSIPSNPPPGR